MGVVDAAVELVNGLQPCGGHGAGVLCLGDMGDVDLRRVAVIVRCNYGGVLGVVVDRYQLSERRSGVRGYGSGGVGQGP